MSRLKISKIHLVFVLKGFLGHFSHYLTVNSRVVTGNEAEEGQHAFQARLEPVVKKGKTKSAYQHLNLTN